MLHLIISPITCSLYALFFNSQYCVKRVVPSLKIHITRNYAGGSHQTITCTLPTNIIWKLKQVHQVIFPPNTNIFPYITVVFHWLINWFSQSNTRFLPFREKLKKKQKPFFFKIGYSSHNRRQNDCSSELSPPGFQTVSTKHTDLASNVIPKTHFNFMTKRKQFTPYSFKGSYIISISVHQEWCITVKKLYEQLWVNGYLLWHPILVQVQGLHYSPLSSRFRYIRFHLFSWLQQPHGDGCHQESKFQHPPH